MGPLKPAGSVAPRVVEVLRRKRAPKSKFVKAFAGTLKVKVVVTVGRARGYICGYCFACIAKITIIIPVNKAVKLGSYAGAVGYTNGDIGRLPGYKCRKSDGLLITLVDQVVPVRLGTRLPVSLLRQCQW